VSEIKEEGKGILRIRSRLRGKRGRFRASPVRGQGLASRDRDERVECLL